MIFNYHSDAGASELFVSGDKYTHIFKSRRTKEGDILDFSNFRDKIIYSYEIRSVDKKEAKLFLLDSSPSRYRQNRFLRLYWCVVDFKSIEKSLAFLNELGLSEIIFIYCDRSQKNYTINLDRIDRILIGSNEQCGRDEMMKISFISSLESLDDSVVVLDLEGEDSQYLLRDCSSILVGCEGGFSEDEREFLKRFKKAKLNTPYVLKSENAAITATILNLLR